MQRFLVARRRPTTLERLLGRRRARRLRRRAGLLAVGAGVALLRPRRDRVVVLMTGALVGATMLTLAFVR